MSKGQSPTNEQKILRKWRKLYQNIHMYFVARLVIKENCILVAFWKIVPSQNYMWISVKKIKAAKNSFKAVGLLYYIILMQIDPIYLTKKNWPKIFIASLNNCLTDSSFVSAPLQIFLHLFFINFIITEASPLKIPSHKIVKTSSGPIRSFTIKENHIGHAISEIIRCKYKVTHTDRQAFCYF